MVRWIKMAIMMVDITPQDLLANAVMTVLLVLLVPEVRKENRDEAVSRATGEYKVHLDTFS